MVLQVATVTGVMCQWHQVATARQTIELSHIKGHDIVHAVLQIGLAPGRMSQGEENVPKIHIDGKAATVPDIEEAVNVAKDVQHPEIIGVEANPQSADETTIDQENWLTIETTTPT